MPIQQQVPEATSPSPTAHLSEQQDAPAQPPLLLNDISPELQRRIDLIDAVMQELLSMQVGFQRRLRAFPQAGGLIATIFDTLNKELLSLLPGYTGSSVQGKRI